MDDPVKNIKIQALEFRNGVLRNQLFSPTECNSAFGINLRGRLMNNVPPKKRVLRRSFCLHPSFQWRTECVCVFVRNLMVRLEPYGYLVVSCSTGPENITRESNFSSQERSFRRNTFSALLGRCFFNIFTVFAAGTKSRGARKNDYV